MASKWIFKKCWHDSCESKSCSILSDPMQYTVDGTVQARILEWAAVPFSRGSSQPSDQTQVSALQADFLPAEPPGKPCTLFKLFFSKSQSLP